MGEEFRNNAAEFLANKRGLHFNGDSVTAGCSLYKILERVKAHEGSLALFGSSDKPIAFFSHFVPGEFGGVAGAFFD